MSRGIPADSEKAIYWLKKCADSGNDQAAIILGAEYFKIYIANGSLFATEEAEKYLKPQADKGNYEAQAMLGSLYCKLEAYEEALPYLEVTAPADDIDSQITLGYMYLSGYGVTKDLPKALYWFKKAAELGGVSAQQRLNELEK